MQVSIFDPKVRHDLAGYLKIGLPSMITLIVEFISYEVTIIYLGQIGIDNQATQILLLNFFALNLMLAFGY
jgi:Na+-driven multidrug efflux pump